MGLLVVQICVGLLLLTCGQILFWRRRDNVLGYVQAGLFSITLLLPLLGTNVLELFTEDVVRLYANLLLLGAACYLAGMCFGAPLGSRPASGSRLTFTHPLTGGQRLKKVLARSRALTFLGSVSLVASFLLLGYAPLFASDPQAAKYGVGVYESGFNRGFLVYRFALALASAVLPVAVAVLYRRRRFVDFGLVMALCAGLILSLSRTLAFSGLLIFAVALAIERRIRPFAIFGMVVFVFVAGALSNELFFPPPDASLSSLPSRVALSVPDLRDQLGFIRGFELRGEERPGWALLAGLKPGEDRYDPTNYALRTLTGAPSVEGFASGGLRLPAPIWGYATGGHWGAAAWAFIAGVFTGWGTVRIRRLLTDVKDTPGSSINLTLATVFYLGTFGLLSTFYFATSSMFVLLAVALYLGRSIKKPEESEDEWPSEGSQLDHQGAKSDTRIR